MNKRILSLAVLVSLFCLVPLSAFAQSGNITPEIIAQCKVDYANLRTAYLNLQTQCRATLSQDRLTCVNLRMHCNSLGVIARKTRNADDIAAYQQCIMVDYPACQENLNNDRTNCTQDIGDARTAMSAKWGECNADIASYNQTCAPLRSALYRSNNQVRIDQNIIQSRQFQLNNANRRYTQIQTQFANQMARLKQQQDQLIIFQGINCGIGAIFGNYTGCGQLADQIANIQLQMGQVQGARSNALAAASVVIANAQDNLNQANANLASDQAAQVVAQNAFNAAECK